MLSPLENLCGPGKPLRQEAPDAKELAGLQQSGLRRLADAENPTNSVEGRFDLVTPSVSFRRRSRIRSR